MSVLLAIFLQVGISPTPSPVSAVPDELYEQRQLTRQAKREAEKQTAIDNPLTDCITLAETDPEAARAMASQWLDTAELSRKSWAAQCLGMALVQQGRWDDAAAAFINGRDAAMPGAQLYRAQLGAMAGNAALSAGNASAALAALDIAQADAGQVGNSALAGEIMLDRARALVALDRLEDAATALGLARQAQPDHAQTWLLSATLSRRMNLLETAQEQIERAAMLAPMDAETGVEAGVIAILSGRPDAARKSWASVVETAPGTSFAQTAQAYISQVETP